MFESAGEAMQDSAEAGGFPVLLKHVEAIVPGVPAVDDDGQLRGAGEFHLLAENGGLHVARGVVVEVVEADLAPGDYLGMPGEPRQFIEVLGGGFLGFVGVDADACEDPAVPFGVWQSSIELFGTWTGTYGEEGVHA